MALAAHSVAGASEPAGHAELAYAWDVSPATSSSEPRALTITVKPVVGLGAAEVTWEAPAGIAIRPAGSEPASVAATSWLLGDLTDATTRVLTFEVRAGPGAGGIAVFRLSGNRADGRRVAEGMGIPMGAIGSSPARRFGAVEYPAASAAPERP